MFFIFLGVIVNKEERVVYMADWFQHLTPEKREERNEGAKDWQQKHPEQFRKKCEEYRKLRKNAEYWKEYFRKLKKWAVDKKGRKCEDCGLVSEYDCVYDFHHENGVGTWSKEENSSNARTKELIKWRKANSIPETCKLLCANCHRIRTFKQLIN